MDGAMIGEGSLETRVAPAPVRQRSGLAGRMLRMTSPLSPGGQGMEGMRGREPSRALRRGSRLRSGWLVRVGVTLVLVLLLGRLMNARAVGRLILSAQVLPLLAAVAFSVADRVVMIGKWYPLLRAQLPAVPLRSAIRVYVAAGLAYYFLPISVGADILRAAALGRERGETARVTASVVVERVLGLGALGVACALSLVVATRTSESLHALLPWALLVILLSLGVLVLPLSGRAGAAFSRWAESRVSRLRGTFVGRLGTAYLAYSRHRRILLWSGLLSLLEQAFPILTMWLLAIGLGSHVTLPMLVVAMPPALFAGRLPISVAGLGVAEGALVYILSLFGVPVTEAAALAILGRLMDILVVALPGVFLWRHLAPALRAYPVLEEASDAGSGRSGDLDR